MAGKKPSGSQKAKKAASGGGFKRLPSAGAAADVDGSASPRKRSRTKTNKKTGDEDLALTDVF